MTKLEKDLEDLMKKHHVTKIAASKPKTCPTGTTAVQITVAGKKIWVCR